MESEIITVILWLTFIKFSQMTIYPHLKPAFGNLSYGLSYPAGMLLFTLISWYLGFMNLPSMYGAMGYFKESGNMNFLPKEA